MASDKALISESLPSKSQTNEENADSEETLLALHRKQRKDLQAQVQALKKTATKGDKKKKKEVTDEVAKLEAELESKQVKELEVFKESLAQLAIQVSHISVNDQGESESSQTSAAPKVTKAQKRRDNKSNKEKEREVLIALQEKDNLQGKRHIETQTIKALLKAKGLQISEIPSDGNCMYAALVHQLQSERAGSSTAELRHLTAEYMQNNVDDFLPFLDDPVTGDIVDLPAYQEYCHKVESTAAWGGHLELRALSHVLKKPLEVTQAEGPVLIIGEEYNKAKPLRLTYHRHMYGLGEHYNSVEVWHEESADVQERVKRRVKINHHGDNPSTGTTQSMTLEFHCFLGFGYGRLRLSFPGEARGFGIAELVTPGPTVLGWQSAPYCIYPQHVVLKLEYYARVGQIQMLLHQLMIPQELSIEVSDRTMVGNTISHQDAGFYHVGHVTLPDNQASEYKARQLFSIVLDCEAALIRLSMSQPHHNKRNIYNQVSLVAINVLGAKLEPQKGTQTTWTGQPTISPYNDLSFFSYVDPEIAKHVNAIEKRKAQAKKDNRAEYMKRLEHAQQQALKGGEILGKLDLEKRLATEHEDFKLAKQKRQQSDQYRQSVNDHLKMSELLESNGSRIPRNDSIFDATKAKNLPALLPLPKKEKPTENVPPPKPEPAPKAKAPPPEEITPPKPKSPRKPIKLLSVHFHSKKAEESSPSPKAPLPPIPEPTPRPLSAPSLRPTTPPEPEIEKIFEDQAITPTPTPQPTLDHDLNVPRVPNFISAKEENLLSGEPGDERNDKLRLTNLGEDMNLAIAVFGPTLVDKMCSKRYQSRDEALQLTKEYMDKYNPSLVPRNATPSTPTPTTTKLRRSNTMPAKNATKLPPIKSQSPLPRPPSRVLKDGDVTPKQMSQAAMWFVSRGLKDTVLSTSTSAGNLLIHILSKFGPRYKVSDNDLSNMAAKVTPDLLQKIGDTNLRLATQATDTLMKVATLPTVKTKGAVGALIAQPLEGAVLPRQAAARVFLVNNLMESCDPTQKDSGWTVRKVAEFAATGLQQPGEEVRKTASNIIVHLYPHDPKGIRRLLPDPDLARKQTTFRDLYAKLDALDKKRALEKKAASPQPKSTAAPKKRQSTPTESAAALKRKLAIVQAPASNSTTQKSQPASAPKATTKPPSTEKTLAKDNPTSVAHSPVPVTSTAKAQPIIDEKTCLFCLERKSEFDTSGLNQHYLHSCKMLTRCAICQQVVEVGELTVHRLRECPTSKFKECPRCKEAVPEKDHSAHVKAASCKAAGNSVMQRCPFCHNDIQAGDENWRKHLLGSKGCTANPRAK